ncbi:glycoside hydrolase domain-containing protein [Sutcliffiella deserti]|uniref:glycoside hydrolase domain-containing protein n=1 Tax=Sutcliffiella deserti TaxID=2875501 RepID=UPI001CBD55C9|nr:glycoside hydrolase domain-containing protein [Sutcliffiella deserti]
MRLAGKYPLQLLAAFFVFLSCVVLFFCFLEVDIRDRHTKSDNINIQITNNIQNNISGESSATIQTTVTNHIEKDGESSIDNNLINTIDGSGDADINNTVENDLAGNGKGLVENTLENNLNGSGQYNLSNNLANNVGSDVNANVQNNVTSSADGNSSDEDNGNGNGNGEEDQGDIVWGIDSASLTTEDFYGCVRDNFGDPVVFGRYLGDKEGVSFGLTEDQVALIHGEQDYILPIYNMFNDATGFDNGVTQAENAIQLAQEIGIPEGVALFADIEPNYPVDSEFIRGWYETITSAGYESGIYGIFDPERALFDAYIQANENNSELGENNIIWTASPNIGITTEAEAPDFNPEAPEDTLAWGWQYGLDAETCNIDTNLFSSEILEFLWAPDSEQ